MKGEAAAAAKAKKEAEAKKVQEAKGKVAAKAKVTEQSAVAQVSNAELSEFEGFMEVAKPRIADQRATNRLAAKGREQRAVVQNV